MDAHSLEATLAHQQVDGDIETRPRSGRPRSARARGVGARHTLAKGLRLCHGTDDAEKLRDWPWSASGNSCSGPPRWASPRRGSMRLVGERRPQRPLLTGSNYHEHNGCPVRQRPCERGASGPVSNGVGRGWTRRAISAQPWRFCWSASGGVGLSGGFASRRSPVRSRYAP
jgi:hypothetical protein